MPYSHIIRTNRDLESIYSSLSLSESLVCFSWYTLPTTGGGKKIKHLFSPSKATIFTLILVYVFDCAYVQERFYVLKKSPYSKTCWIKLYTVICCISLYYSFTLVRWFALQLKQNLPLFVTVWFILQLCCLVAQRQALTLVNLCLNQYLNSVSHSLNHPHV